MPDTHHAPGTFLLQQRHRGDHHDHDMLIAVGDQQALPDDRLPVQGPNNGGFRFREQRAIRTAHRQHAGNLRVRHPAGVMPYRQHHGGVGADQDAIGIKCRRRIDNGIEDGIQFRGPALHLGEQPLTLLLGLFALRDVIGDPDNRPLAVILGVARQRNPPSAPDHLWSCMAKS